jgi:hypothetical protein
MPASWENTCILRSSNVDRDFLRPRSARAHRQQGHSWSTAACAVGTGVQRRAGVPGTTAADSADDLRGTRPNCTRARLSRYVPAAAGRGGKIFRFSAEPWPNDSEVLSAITHTMVRSPLLSSPFEFNFPNRAVRIRAFCGIIVLELNGTGAMSL